MKAAFPIVVAAGVLLFVAYDATAQQREGGKSSEAWFTPTVNGKQIVNIECSEGHFDPPEIVVKANVPVELSVRTGHGAQDGTVEFVNQSFAPTNRALVRQPTKHQFTPSTRGDFEMSCQRAGTGNTGPVRKGILRVVD